MKRGLAISGFLFTILFIHLIKALTIQDIFSQVDPTTVTLAIYFVVLFVVLFFATSKVFKTRDVYGRPNNTIPAIISLAIALLAVYWLNQATNVGNLLASIGITGDNVYTLGAVLMIAFLVFLIIKIKGKTFLVFGAICLLAAVMGWVYESTALGIIGAISIIIGIYFVLKKKRGAPIGNLGNPINVHHNYNYGGNTTNVYNQVEKEKREERERERARESDIENMERKAAADAQAARERENADVRQRQAAMVEAAKTQQEERSLISTDINSLMNSYRALEQTYNQIYNQDPSNPRLRDLMTDMIRIRDEMIRIKRGQR